MKFQFITILLLFTLFLNLTAYCQMLNYEREWATYFGGENTTLVDNDSDTQGNIYIAGYIAGVVPYSNQFMTPGSFQPAYGGGSNDGFIAKFNPDGLLIWSTFFGGSGNEIMTGIHIDKDDNIYITGETTSNGLATIGAYQTSLSGESDGFIAKFSSNGSRIWSTYFGGNQNEAAHGLETDFLGRVYLYGKTTSTTGITTTGSFQETWDNSSGVGNDFISSFSADGQLIWSTYYGLNQPSNTSRITGIAVGNNFIYVAGFVIDGVSSPYFATVGCYQSTNSNNLGVGADMFLSKFSFSGERLWSTYYGGGVIERSVGSGGNGDRNLHTVATTPNAVYIAGLSNSPNNVASVGSFQTSKQGYSNFIAKFNHDGTRQWGTYLGNTTVAPSTGVFSANTAMLTTTSVDEVYISGSTYMTDIASPASYQSLVSTEDETGLSQNNDSYIAKLSADGTTREYATYYGGFESEQGSRSLIHQNGFYMLGTTYSTQNISTPNSYQPELDTYTTSLNQRPSNAFIAKFCEIPLSIAKSSLDQSVIYPVPNNGNFTARLNANYIGSQIEIFDLQGRKIYQQKIEQSISDVKMIVPDGNYILKITSANKMEYSRKILIKN